MSRIETDQRQWAERVANERSATLLEVRRALDALEESGSYAEVSVAIDEEGAREVWGDDAVMASITYRLPASGFRPTTRTDS